MDRLRDFLQEIECISSDDIISKFYAYMNGILEYNEMINLTAITDKEEFIEKHVIESLVCAEYIKNIGAKKAIDIGTGAGFPGVPNAIVFENCNFTLVDSIRKKLNVIETVCSQSKIENVKTVHERAETLAHTKAHREKYDICMSRAVSNLTVLSEYCLPFVREGGVLIAVKGDRIDDELESARNAIKILGGEIEDVQRRKLSNKDNISTIVVIKKINMTPELYPRKPGIPSKHALV